MTLASVLSCVALAYTQERRIARCGSMKREADNAWHYLKYSEDCKKLQHMVNLVISEKSPRYIKNLPESIHEVAARIVEYKIRRAEINKIDSYFDK